MQQYVIKEALEEEISLANDLYKYLVKVVKVKLGAEILLFNGKEKAIYTISRIENKQIILNYQQKVEVELEGVEIDLAFGSLKKEKNEWIIQKATELGVNDLYVLTLKNCISRLKATDQKKKERFNKIITSAVEQSKRNSIPNIKLAVTLNELEFANYEQVFVAHEKHEDILFGQKLIELTREEKNFSKGKSLILIGPEGGFDQEEIDIMSKNKNVEFISLGKNILRAETAAVSALATFKLLIK